MRAIGLGIGIGHFRRAPSGVPGAYLTGDQRASVTVSSTAGLFTFVAGTDSDLVNGGTSGETKVYSAAVIGDGSKSVSFSTAGSRRLTEIKFYQQSGFTSTHGVWQVEAFDGTSWVAKGSPFTLGGATVQTITELNSNVNNYSSYRLRHLSGVTNSGPYWQEFEFRVV